MIGNTTPVLQISFPRPRLRRQTPRTQSRVRAPSLERSAFETVEPGLSELGMSVGRHTLWLRAYNQRGRVYRYRHGMGEGVV